VKLRTLAISLYGHEESLSVPVSFETRALCNYVQRYARELKIDRRGFNQICIHDDPFDASKASRLVSEKTLIVPFNFSHFDTWKCRRSELIWGKYRDTQNVYYLHGALPFFDTGVEIVKEEYDAYNYLLERISARMDKGEYPIFVTAGDGQQKLKHIMHNRYLAHCYESLCRCEGSLVTFGFNFGPYDEHVIDAINRAARQRPSKKLWSIYVGVYSKSDQEHLESLAPKFKCKVHVYDAKTVKVWG